MDRQDRWVAIRQGLSKGGRAHVHVVVGLVAEDGRQGPYGLRRLEARTPGTGTRTTQPGERWAVQCRGATATGWNAQRSARWETLERIVRACATSEQNESDFVRSLREHGSVRQSGARVRTNTVRSSADMA